MIELRIGVFLSLFLITLVEAHLMNRRVFLQTTSSAALTALSSPLFAGAQVTSPFLGSWLHMQQLFREANSTAERERLIDEMLDGHRSVGLRTVIPFITDTSGGALFPSRVIRGHTDDDWDVLDYLIRGAAKRDLEVYPAFCALVCGHMKPKGVLLDQLDWASCHPDGSPMGHLCPTHPAVRDWVTSVVADVVERYPVNGIMLDYLRYYNRPSRLDPSSEKQFTAWRQSQSDVSDERAFQVYREAGITKLVRQISETVRDSNPGLKIAIYSWGPHVAHNHQVAQPWPDWSRDRLIDQVSISGYCYPDNYGDRYLEVFSRRIGDSVELNQIRGGKAHVTFTLGISTSHGQIRDAGWINDYLNHAVEQGVKGVAIYTWSYFQPYIHQTVRLGYLPAFVERFST